jgi:hypothetical protein
VIDVMTAGFRRLVNAMTFVPIENCDRFERGSAVLFSTAVPLEVL